MFKQLKSFNQSTAGRKPGYCLQNVRFGFNIKAKYPSAITAWYGTQQHRDRNIPSKVDVPLFYSWKLAGHINVQLANGQVWSDGNLYKNLADYEKRHPAVKYLGWGESVNGVAVIQYAPDPVKPSTDWTGKTVYLKPVPTWRVYVPNTRIVKAVLKPAKFGGLSYKIQGKDSLGRALIDTRDFGRVALPIDGDATIK